MGGIPSKVLYPVDYLPMASPAAEEVLQELLGKLNATFGTETVQFNFSQTTLEADNAISNITQVGSIIGAGALDQWVDYGRDVVANYRAENDGRFPPLNPSTRRSWMSEYEADTQEATVEERAAADAVQASLGQWFGEELLGLSPESCSESIMIYDIGTRGLPSYREQTLNTRYG